MKELKPSSKRQLKGASNAEKLVMVAFRQKKIP